MNIDKDKLKMLLLAHTADDMETLIADCEIKPVGVKPKPKTVWILFDDDNDIKDLFQYESSADETCEELGYGRVVEFKEVTDE